VVDEYWSSGPLDVVQIDHTTVDLIVVDDVTRQPIGRPVLTVAIDVHTRLVTGFYLAMDYPSTLRAGVCVAHSVFEKGTWLAERGIDVPWPAAGLPRAVHVDNAGEFHSGAFTRTLEDFGVEVIYRPVARPHFGGHVERLIGTTMGAVHLLRGTTFSSIRARGHYPAEARATMTLRELERWLALEILGKYHQRIHSALQRPPIAVWSELTASTPARMPKERLEFLTGLLPYEWRLPRRDGVHLFGIRYWSDALVSLLGRHEQKLMTRYDPRDLSRVWVRRPDGRHVEARYKNLVREPISLWEHSRAMARLREQGRQEVTEEILFQTIREQRRIEDEALWSSKQARRSASQRPSKRAIVPRDPPDLDIIDTSDPTCRPFLAKSSMIHEEVSSDDEQRWLAGAGEVERITYVRAERWITYPRAAAVLDQMQRLLDHPRNSRMPSLLIIGESGIGKTQLDLKFCRDHPARFDEKTRRTVSPVVSVQMPAAPTDRLFYMMLLRAFSAVFPPRISAAEAMIMAFRLYAELGVRIVIFDEIHNLLAGTFRDQRRILTQLRYLSNELQVWVVCLGIETARDAMAGDPQLARRFSLVELPAWEVDADFRSLVATLLRHLPLRNPSVLDTAALQTVIRATRGNTARVFQLLGDLAVAAICSGEERITAEAIGAWQPSVYDRALAG
jgi:putative transposase